jgi:hypothetical protein
VPRDYVCSTCSNTFSVNTRRGPLPKWCDGCKVAAGKQLQTAPSTFVARAGAPAPAAPKATPFNSTPTTAPLPSPARAVVSSVPAGLSDGDRQTSPPPAHPGPGPGPLERQLLAELAAIPSTAVLDGTLRSVALMVAQMADQADDFRSKMQAVKEYRSILAQLTAGRPAAEAPTAVVDTSEPAGPFGPCRPELTGEVDLGECVPRWATRRRLERPTWGPYFGRVAAAMGKTYMPWQQHAADIAGEVDHRGMLCYQQFIATVPRQSGKTTFLLPVLVGRAEAGAPFGGRQNMLYAAQTQTAGVAKFNKEYLPELRGADVTRGTFTKIVTGGVPTITFTSTGTTLSPTTTGSKASHGEVLDVGLLDEAFSQPDDAVEGAWLPAMITRPMRQLVIVSTAGDSTSVYFKAKVDAGRRAAELDSGYGTAYLEYSADDTEPGFDPGDETMWRRVMPAAGRTQPIEALRSLYNTMVLEGKLSTWLRAFLNIWVDRVSDPVFRAGRWENCHNPDAERASRPVLAVDVSADRTHACIAMGAAAADGTPMVRVIDYQPGTAWVVDRLLQLREQYDVAAVVLDSVGPVKSMVPDLDNEYIQHEVTTAGDMAAACGALYDAVDDQRIYHFGEPALQLAVVGAEKRQLLDAWAWTRRKASEGNQTDISPLVAVTLAYWGQLKYGDDPGEDGSGGFG